MPRYYGNQAGEGLTLMLIGGLIGSPFLFYFGFFEYMTAPVYYYSAGLVATSGAAATGISAVAILGLGALVTYGAVGLGYIYFAAKDAYSNNKGLGDIVKSRLFNQDGWSFKGVMTSIGAALWSPFLLIGGLAGMGIKATVQAYKRARLSSVQESEASSNDAELSSYHAAQEGMGNGATSKSRVNSMKKDVVEEAETNHRRLFVAPDKKTAAPDGCQAHEGLSYH